MLIENMQSLICSCGKKYKHVQSFNRHIKNCKKGEKQENQIIKENTQNENELLRIMITTLIEQNNNILLENKEMRDMVTTIIPKNRK